jgi:5-methylcytosine-specific restriction endonuclease McrA
MSLSLNRHICKNCEKEKQSRYNHKNEFCSQSCFLIYRWENDTKIRIEQGLVKNTSPYTLKRYLIEKFGNKCALCPQDGVWNGKELELQLDHIDGNNRNNLPLNLRLLCPNCHTQTDTYSGKRRKR